MLQTVTQLLRTSRTTSYSTSFQPCSDLSTISCGDVASALVASAASASDEAAKPEPGEGEKAGEEGRERERRWARVQGTRGATHGCRAFGIPRPPRENALRTSTGYPSLSPTATASATVVAVPDGAVCGGRRAARRGNTTRVSCGKGMS